MRIIKRLALLLASILIAALSLTGCAASDKLELLNAFEKTSALNSWESHSTISFSRVSLSTNAEELDTIQSFIDILNGTRLELRQKVSQNPERTIGRTQTDMQLTLGDATQQLSLWSAHNFTQQDPRLLQVMKLPDIVSASLPDDLAGKEYMVLDQGNGEETGGINPQSYTQMMESMKSIQTRILDLMKEYAVKNDPDFAVINKLKDTVINGESFTTYRLELDDSSLKALMSYGLNEIAENENAKNLIKELIVTAVGASGGTDAAMDLESAFEELRNGTPFREDVKELMNVLDNVRLLGSQGIVLNILINRDGYIVNQNGLIDLYLDSAELENAMEKLGGREGAAGEGGSGAVFTIAMYFNMDTYSLNKAVNIDFPELTGQNSFRMSDISNISAMSSAVKPVKRSKTTAVEVNSRIAAGIGSPIRIGSRIFVPLEPLCRALGVSCEYGKASDIGLTVKGRHIQLHGNSRTVILGKEKQELALPVMSIDGRIYVPEQFVEQYLGANVYYNGVSNRVTVRNK